MRLRRCALGLGILALLLAWAAFLLDDPAMVFATGIILAALAGQAFLFDRQFRAMAASVRLTRTADRTIVRRGASLNVDVAVNVAVPPGLDVSVKELVPARVALQDGKILGTAGSGEAGGTIHFSYTITAVVHGRIPFEGITLQASNLFFEESIDMTTDPFRGPVLMVHPRGAFEGRANQMQLETREIERISAMTGYGIRAIRDYLTGDDLRRIDWKLSAKYDKLMVREYSAVIVLSPLIIIDLPRKGTPYPEAAFDSMVAAVTGRVRHSVRAHQGATILFLSGPNILHLLENEKDENRCLSELGIWLHPAEQADVVYRHKDRTALRSRVRKLDETLGRAGNPPDQRFLRIQARISGAAIQHQQDLVFSGQLARVVAPLPVDDIYLFSLYHGDTSHLRQAVRVLGKNKTPVHVLLPRTIDTPPGALRTTLGADSVEAFA